ncbi:Protein of unknown function [Pseudoxanthomonas sp. GM95]|uniref:DUF2884 family protein n=1 Tax=Pseudoxanthomonas sp. GM95 TaxID=1881043 RepID=UPI0008D7DDB0|nr:DUF2884 family protein [Pseudoxanthomonas sp. GM95]SEM10631.1 Protein of unknown function [Pseudoxanthomonas sp. GM95]
MRHALLPLLLSLCMVCAAHADEPTAQPNQDKAHHKVKLSSEQCGLSTPFNVLVDAGGVWLYRDQGLPKEIFFHGGELSVDRKVRPVSAADAQRLWQMESEARTLMPKVTDLARGMVDLTFDALSSVIDQITGSPRKARKVEPHRKAAMKYVDDTLGTGRWDQEIFDEGFEQRVESAAEQLSGMLARSVLWQVFTGRADAIDERADRMDADLDARMDAQGEVLEAKAKALCPQVEMLYALQDALEYRYEGQPLRMIEVDKNDTPEIAQAAPAPSSAPEDHGDHRDTAIKLDKAK